MTSWCSIKSYQLTSSSLSILSFNESKASCFPSSSYDGDKNGYSFIKFSNTFRDNQLTIKIFSHKVNNFLAKLFSLLSLLTLKYHLVCAEAGLLLIKQSCTTPMFMYSARNPIFRFSERISEPLVRDTPSSETNPL